MTLAEQIDVFYGRVMHRSAEVYVRVGSLVGGGDWSLAGQVRGPLAPGTRTLPLTVTLRDLGAGPTLLAGCAIPDPTFWTTQMPAAYEMQVQLVHRGQVVESAARTLGIRFFGASGRNFVWEGKRWVLRGVATPVHDAQQVEAFGDNNGVIVVSSPSESLLEKASDSGVLLVVEPAGRDWLRELRELTRWPAVGMVILPGQCAATDVLRAAAPNLLFAQRIARGEPITPTDWADVLLCDASQLEALPSAMDLPPIPTIALRQLPGDFTLIEARRQCDQLQQDLASRGDFAGYVIQVEAGSQTQTSGPE